MSKSFFRVIHVPRRTRRSGNAPATAPKGPAPVPGIDFSPVHGRHCICGRCETQTRRRSG